MTNRLIPILRTFCPAIFALFFVATSAHAARLKPETIRLNGDAQSLAAVIFPIIDRFQKETGVRITTITEESPLASLKSLDTGKCDAMISALSFEELNRQADSSALKRGNAAMTQHVALFSNLNYQVIVNPKNPISSINDVQLQKIFSGKYDNWDDLDGPDLPISIVWGCRSTGSAWVLADRIMGDSAVTANSIVAADTAEIVEKVSSLPGAVAILPKQSVISSVKVVNTPDLKINGPIILVTVGFPQNPVYKLIKFIRDNGTGNIGF